MSVLSGFDFTITATAIAGPSWGSFYTTALVFAGLVGVSLTDWIWGDDESASSNGSDDLDGAGEDDLFEEDDELEEFDDWDDEFAAGDEGVSDLEPRIDELENEVASVSSTVSTVRSENEAISDSVGEIEENVRKLLNIYDMVTRGVNPFVDDAQPGLDSDTFGLFEDDGDEADNEELENDIASADAESFFDEDFDEDLEEDMVSEDEDDLFEDDDNSTGSSDGAQSFDDLKAEYESGDAEWADQADSEEPDEPVTDDEHDDPDVEDIDSSVEANVEEEWSTGDEEAAIDEGETDSPSQSSKGADTNDPGRATTDRGDSEASSSRAALSSLPDGYSAEVLVLEWMDYLLDRSSVGETLRAIEYYRNRDWISDDVADYLIAVALGLGQDEEGDTPRVSRAATSLELEDHYHSLKYIGRFANGDFGASMLEQR